MRLGTSGNSSHLPTFSEPEGQGRHALIDIFQEFEKLKDQNLFKPQECLQKSQNDLKNQIDK